MTLCEEDPGWTLVHRRRRRDQRWSRQPSSHSRQDRRPPSAYPARPSYAAVLQRPARDLYGHKRSHRYDGTSADRPYYAQRHSAPPQQRRETYRGHRAGPELRQSRHLGSHRPSHPPAAPPQQPRAAGKAQRGRNWINTQDPNFTCKVRIMFRIIKAQHHLHVVRGPATPPFIQRITDYLTAAIQPAFCSPSFTEYQSLTTLAWGETTIDNLYAHYKECMLSDMKELAALPAYEWHGPFQIAESWACRNLGRRLSQEAVQQAKTFIDKHLTPPPQAGNLPQQPPPAPTAAAAPPPSSSAAASSGLSATLPVAMATQQSTAEIAAPARHTPVCTASTSIHLQPATENNDTFISRCKDNAAKPGQSAPLDLPLFSSPLPPRAARRQAVHVPPVLASPISAGTQGTSGTSPRRASTHQPSSSSAHNPCVHHKNLLIEAETELSQALSSSPPLLATPLPRDVISPGLSPIQRGSTHPRPRPLSTPVLSEDEDTLPEEVNQLLSTRPSQTPVSGPPPPPPAGRRLTRQSSVACQTPPLHRRAR